MSASVIDKASELRLFLIKYIVNLPDEAIITMRWDQEMGEEENYNTGWMEKFPVGRPRMKIDIH